MTRTWFSSTTVAAGVLQQCFRADGCRRARAGQVSREILCTEHFSRTPRMMQAARQQSSCLHLGDVHLGMATRRVLLQANGLFSGRAVDPRSLSRAHSAGAPGTRARAVKRVQTANLTGKIIDCHAGDSC